MGAERERLFELRALLFAPALILASYFSAICIMGLQMGNVEQPGSAGEVSGHLHRSSLSIDLTYTYTSYLASHSLSLYANLYAPATIPACSRNI
ncbi:hypothetical protein L211DRAFT_839489 [Terfezia boudieri ATCC MYA-4762]|uniref:Uncharacterized protein n=1 Tax=Terfezia boudieri ATCC MYA-4762 TaxID=1051890 RepID=A0A3N4LLY0_9PEZI|nr:hypothetical protein L211DRAFT_839489 [Terfezia boudieri ATCC MYA-4762]